MLDTLPILRRFRTRPTGATAPLFTRVAQVCTVVDEFEATIGRLVDQLGIGPFRCWHFRPPTLYRTTFRGRPAEWTMKLGITWLGDVQWEVIQPVSGASLYREHLEARGRGVQHLLMDTGATPFEAAAARLAALGHPLDQTAMVNARVKVGRFELPPVPDRIARPMSLQFGYLDLERELGTAIELTRYPLGFSERFALRAGRAERCVPDGDSRFERPLAHLRVDRVEKATIVTRDLERTIRSWAGLGGVRPWRHFEVAQPGFRARLAQAAVGATTIELIEPGGGESPWHQLLATRGEGVATIGVSARGGAGALCDHLRAAGCAIPWQGALTGGRRSAFVAARPAFGTDLEVLDAP
jgi:hypothetical protein